MIFNPVIQGGGGGVTMDELFFGNESTVSVSVEGYKAILILYSYYAGTTFMEVGHAPINLLENDGYLSVGTIDGESEILGVSYSDGTAEISNRTTSGAIYAVYGIK